ncbi:MAG: GAF domain-containing protein [Chloroflexota bacterium]|nr:GAF domain-containing protein [Chloroflexota bacterium]
MDLRGWRAYGFAAALAGGSVLLKGALAELLATDTGYIVFVPAIALSAWLGGFRAGLLATLVAALLNLWIFVAPTPSLDVITLSDQLRLVVFLLAGAIIGGLSGRLRDALRDTEDLARQGDAVATIGEEALSGSPTRQLLSEAATLVAETLRTPIVAISELDADQAQLHLAAGVGWPEGAVGTATIRVGAHSHAGYTLSHDGPVIVADFRHEKRFELSEPLRRMAPRSGIAVRIGGSAHPYGVLGAWSRDARRFTTDEANFLQSVGNVLAAATSRAAVEGDLVRSRDQLEAVLGSVTDGITVQDADGRLIYANQEAATLLGFASTAELLGADVPEVMTRLQVGDEGGSPLSLDALPSTQALRGHRGAERLIRFTVLDTDEERWALAQAAPVLDDKGQVRFAVNTFRDVTQSRRREEADRFLADATAVLATSLDDTATIERLAGLAIERLADWCVVDLLDSDGVGVQTAIAHQDDARQDLARRWRQLTPFDIAGESAPARVIRTRLPELVADIDPKALEKSVAGHELGREMSTLGLRSLICVPLMSRGRAIGAVTMATAESGRRFDARHLAVASELGERAGVALENSRLYRDADERRAELMATLSAMGEAVLVFDAEGRSLLHNPAAEGLLAGRLPRTLSELRSILDGDGQATLSWPDAAVERPLELRGKDGRWLEVSAYRARAGTEDGATQGERSRAGSTILVVRDVTAPRAARAAREAFMGLLSHELRTPITTIYGGTRLLEREIAEEQRIEVVRDVRAEAERLYRLVEDLLVMTRVERGGVDIGDEPLLLQRIMDPVVRTEESRWPGLRVDVSISDMLPAVRGDLTYVEQVIRNLLSNAAKYGGLRHPVDLVAEDMGTHVAVRVLDRGPGIGAEEAERLFDLFYRGTSTAAMASGAGIGLFVCRALVTAMGGRMWAAPREGGGSEFGFSLPVLEIDDTP